MTGFCTFETAIGTCGLAWRGEAVVRFQLPEDSVEGMQRRIAADFGGAAATDLVAAPQWVRDVVKRVRAHLETGREDLSTIAVDLSDLPPFHQQVLVASRAIPEGSTMTYGELATSLGCPGAARAVGQALGRNPVALIVPCHRVMAANGRSGGFSAWGGLDTKRTLLAIEAREGFCFPP